MKIIKASAEILTATTELRKTAEDIHSFFGHNRAAALMSRAADLIEKLTPAETPVEQVATKGEE